MSIEKKIEQLIKEAIPIEKRLTDLSFVYITSVTNKEPLLFKQYKPIKVYNFEEKSGKFYTNGKEISLNELDGAINNTVVISHLKSRKIASLLKSIGVVDIIDVTHHLWRNVHMIDVDLHKMNIGNIIRFCSQLDETSKNILLMLIEFRMKLHPAIIKSSPYRQYFHPAMLPLDNAVIIEGGGFNGVSALNFYKESNNTAQIFVYEPDYDNFLLSISNIHAGNALNNIHVFNLGLYSKKAVLKFSQNRQSSLIDDTGKDTIICADIDSFVDKTGLHIDVIKMDIEGAEIDALYGSKKTIERDKPKLMISVYHAGDHLWKIPALIKTIRDDYTFYLGHHPHHLTIYESVLYAK